MIKIDTRSVKYALTKKERYRLIGVAGREESRRTATTVCVQVYIYKVSCSLRRVLAVVLYSAFPTIIQVPSACDGL